MENFNEYTFKCIKLTRTFTSYSTDTKLASHVLTQKQVWCLLLPLHFATECLINIYFLFILMNLTMICEKFLVLALGVNVPGFRIQ